MLEKSNRDGCCNVGSDDDEPSGGESIVKLSISLDDDNNMVDETCDDEFFNEPYMVRNELDGSNMAST